MRSQSNRRLLAVAGLISALGLVGCEAGRSGSFEAGKGGSPGSDSGSNRGGQSTPGGAGSGSGPGTSSPQPGNSDPVTLPGDPPMGQSPPPGEPGTPPMAPGATPPCSVSIVPVLPGRLLELLASETSTLRVRAEVDGPQAPAMPVWQWSVIRQPGIAVPFTPVAGQPEMIEFPLREPGIYHIEATAAPGCSRIEPATAFAPNDRQVTFWARISPPPQSGIPAQDTTFEVGGTFPPAKHFALSRGVPVTVDPQGADGLAIPSFIRISSTRSTVRFEGHNADGGFRVALNPLSTYDVLIVPDGGVAPALLPALSPSQLGANGFLLDAGTPVSGTVTQGEAKTPLPGARVLLRAGRLPSTVGVSDATGAYSLHARPAFFGAVVLPPPDSGLPEARLPDGETVPVLAGGPMALAFSYAPLAPAPLALAVRDAAGAPVQIPVRVELEGQGGPSPGTFTLPKGLQVPAVAYFRAEAITGPDGVARFPAVPPGSYIATAAPQDPAAPVGLTTAPVEVGAATAPAVTLAPKVAIQGRLVPSTLSAGLEVVAVDPEGRASGEAVRTVVGADGSFRLPVARNRTYRLQVEPAPQRLLPRYFLGGVTAASADVAMPEITLHPGISFTGNVTAEAAGVPGAVVQIFCIGKAPECVDPEDAQAGGARALGETVSDDNGQFQVYLPDPAKWNL